MTREEIKNKIIRIIEDEVEADAWDDSGLHIIYSSVEKAAEEIMKLWDKGFTYEVKNERT